MSFYIWVLKFVLNVTSLYRIPRQKFHLLTTIIFISNTAQTKSILKPIIKNTTQPWVKLGLPSLTHLAHRSGVTVRHSASVLRFLAYAGNVTPNRIFCFNLFTRGL